MPDTFNARGFSGRLLMLGCGAIGQGVLPLLLRHLDLGPERIAVLAADDGGRAVAESLGVVFHAGALSPGNHHELLARYLRRGDFLLNLSVDVSSLALISWCREQGVLYLDTGLEEWPECDTGRCRTSAERTTHAQRLAVQKLATDGDQGHPTALITHGANPGLVSHLAKEALLQLARDLGHPLSGDPVAPQQWARLARDLGIRTIHIAEHDSQRAAVSRAANEFVNTWSVAGLIGEGLQPAELGWGSHERERPDDAHRMQTAAGPALCLDAPGLATRVRTWTPTGGAQTGFLITHAEALTLADFLTLPGESLDCPAYRPTVHYAYRPCDDTVASIAAMSANGWQPLPESRVLKDDLAAGDDTLGVLLMGHARGAFWYGSQLDIATARRLAPHNNATSLQVAAAVLAGVAWVMTHPDRGIVEPEALDHRQAMTIMRPYLGDVSGMYTDWRPPSGDAGAPWQFRDFRLA